MMKNLLSPRCGRCISPRLLKSPLLAALILTLSAIFALALYTPAHAQASWQNLTVPKYTNATDYNVKTDEDEYKIYFRSPDDVKTVFDFYQKYLESEGFRVTDSKTKKHGLKADLVREKGGLTDSIELDTKLKHGRYKVEIEFDD